MDADALRNLAASAQPIQFPTYNEANGERTAQEVAAAAAGYAPADSIDPNISNYDLNAQEQDGTLPLQAHLQNDNVDVASESVQALRSPQQTRATRASQNAPANVSYPPPTNGGPSQDDSQNQQDLSQAQLQTDYVWRNASSAFPKGKPQPHTRAQSKQAQVYTTPNGLVHSDPWVSHFYEPTQAHTPTSNNNEDVDPAVAANPFSDHFPLIPNPPDLEAWRHKLFNITEPLVLSEEEYLTYFPHVDNVYSHRSTQKYKRKPFVSHYWDCRLKGRPSGTPKSTDPNKKKRKRQARERDLCDVKIKVTEYFSADEARNQGMSAVTDPNGVDGTDNIPTDPALTGQGGLTIVLEDGVNGNGSSTNPTDPNFGLLELPRRLPDGHPGANGKRWFTIQRVRGNPGGGAVKEKRDSITNGEAPEEEEDSTLLDPNLDLDHKHTLDESDRIKKNTVQRWMLKEEKEKKRQSKLPTPAITNPTPPTTVTETTSPTFRASGMAFFTARSHANPVPSKMIFYANSFCPFAQRVWIALEVKGVPYQMVEVLPAHLDSYRPPELLEVNPEAQIPCIRHGNWAVWESGVMLEYLEDLAMGLGLLPLGNAQLRAHCRLWTDHINRKILPSFYSLLLTPPPHHHQQRGGPDIDGDLDMNGQAQARAASAAQHEMLIATLQKNITSLVNASHATGPFFLGSEIGFVDVMFAPWIIRLSRVLSYYRNFPRPEVGTRWRQWVDAIEADDRVRRTVSDENSYHGIYRGVGEDGWDSLLSRDAYGHKKPMVELEYAKRVVAQEGFGLGGDVWGRLREEDAVQSHRNMDA
ncbi:hypothetical protein LTR10_016588 [Elasticomyces elasticus]|uniref:GST N-terminal domain-containing protein n=1 Tax=Exophiala sideris TaxID=1016849 RepID=A0ABR0JJN5_9EURO|nr:hypothetical protein LTR10_016588 [Elasticomyces elasticus]KAK5035233.1 hypothetical protein LTS07_002669 [Exophiala sideris]KAK5039415.1 hypothetical protein LTR13_003672 [Exophiala sideris]KAK5066157.1 hypothetical protein LTR69_002675 [Exophiala sideris]KAK5186834.1 hypothetical protein LTR44_000840 [Eurotiomycetes sp. CCFEE 6388]